MVDLGLPGRAESRMPATGRLADRRSGNERSAAPPVIATNRRRERSLGWTGILLSTILQSAGFPAISTRYHPPKVPEVSMSARRHLAIRVSIASTAAILS